MFSNTRKSLLAAAVASAAIIGGAVAFATTGATADEPRHLAAQEICDAKPIMIPCDQIDLVSPDRRAALEEDARSTLHGRTPAEALRQTRADLEKLREEHPIKLIGDAGGDGGARPNEISNELPLTRRDFKQANEWVAPDRLAGSHKNAIIIYVGAAADDPSHGLLFRQAEGDTVPLPSGSPLAPVTLPASHGPGAHITAVDHRGVLTIGFDDRSTLRYDAIHDRLL
jgi:hypothetical protein